jgi:hypothetical protein
MRAWFAILVSTTVLFLSTGCGGKKGAAPTAKDLQAFNSAPVDVKQMWDRALEADKTNDYATAEMLLYALVRPDLTKEQREAVINRLTSVKQRLDDGLEKADPAAQAAWEELRRNPPNRQH